jgi:CHAT domain-containing protein
MLIAPARPMLRANARVIIIPDGKLNSLNFETLLVSEPTPHYWIEDVTIEHASSLRLLAAAHTGKEKRGRNLLLFGNTVAPSPEYPELSNAAVEMTSIKKHFPAAVQRVFERDQATAPAYLSSNPEQFSYIHFVAHAMASRLSPLESAIVLSKSGGDSENFKLYARDIIQHPVRADLVTISACYGAGTRAYSGEGLVGLSWAFLRAGAHNVVAALWDASDVSTAQLMDKFYGEMNKGARPDAALRAAKLSLLHSATAFRKPFYWGAFQLYTGS